MKRYLFLILCLGLLQGCNFLKKEQHDFLYAFDNVEKVSKGQLETTLNVIKKRLDRFGLKNEVQVLEGNQIQVSVWSNSLDEERLHGLITNRGKLEFWELYKGKDFFHFLSDLDSELSKSNNGKNKEEHSFSDLISGFGYEGGPVICHVKTKDTSEVNSILRKSDLKILLPNGHKNTKFLWGKVSKDGNHPLYAAKSNGRDKAPIMGTSITDAYVSEGITGFPVVSIIMDDNGTVLWERITGNAFTNRTSIAITFNNMVYSAPGVISGPIKGGRSSISGVFTEEEAQDLAVILSSRYPIPKLILIKSKPIKN